MVRTKEIDSNRFIRFDWPTYGHNPGGEEVRRPGHVLRSYQGHVNHCVAFAIEYLRDLWFGTNTRDPNMANTLSTISEQLDRCYLATIAN